MRRTQSHPATKSRAVLAAFIPAAVALVTPPLAAAAAAPVSVSGYTGTTPQEIALTPDGRTLYVANRGSNTVSIIDTASMSQTGTASALSVADPFGIAVSPDGSFAYVVGRSVGVIDTLSGAQIASVPGISLPYGWVAFSPDGSRAYVTDGPGQVLHVIDTATHTEITRVAGFTGFLLAGVTASPDGSVVFVANYGSSSIQVVDPATNQAIGTVAGYTGRDPVTIAFSSDSTTAYVTNEASGTVSVIDVASLTEVASIPAGQIPSRIQLSADNAFAYVTNARSGTVSIIDTAARDLVGDVPDFTGQTPRGLALTPDGRYAFVGESGSNQIVRLELPVTTRVVDSVTPARSPVGGGVPVTLTGRNLGATTAVTFDGIPGTNLQVADDGLSLSVEAPPHPRGDVPVVVSGMRGDTPVSTPFTYFTVPDAPTSVRSVAGAGSVTVTWSPPSSDGGSPIRGYRVAYAPTGASNPTVVTVSDGTTSTISDLIPGTEYAFQVTAFNDAGSGAPGETRAVPTGGSSESPSPSAPAGSLAASGADSAPLLTVALALSALGAAMTLIPALRRRTRRDAG